MSISVGENLAGGHKVKLCSESLPFRLILKAPLPKAIGTHLLCSCFWMMTLTGNLLKCLALAAFWGYVHAEGVPRVSSFGSLFHSTPLHSCRVVAWRQGAPESRVWLGEKLPPKGGLVANISNRNGRWDGRWREGPSEQPPRE